MIPLLLAAAIGASVAQDPIFCLTTGTNVAYGERIYGDKLLHMANVRAFHSLFQFTSATLSYPAPGDDSVVYISRIEVRDKRGAGNGGCPIIQNGGIGNRSVFMLFRSKLGQGIDSQVRIYGFEYIASIYN